MSATKNPLINVVIALLIAASLVLLCVPCYIAENDSASVMSYIFMNTQHDGVTALLRQSNPDFILNGQVWSPILLFLFGIFSLYMMVVKHGQTVSLGFSLLFAASGILVVWTNELTRLGGVTVLPTVLMVLIAVLCLYNGSWLADSGSNAWRKDPQARRKLNEISKAVKKKNVSLLQAHAHSADPSIRIAAVEALAQVGGNIVFQPLIEQLSCPNPDVRIAAAGALGKLGDTRGRSFLLHYIQSDPDSRVRAAMKRALSCLPSRVE